ncbi:hypothetical protein D3C76_496980 [compost metagenome]
MQQHNNECDQLKSNRIPALVIYRRLGTEADGTDNASGLRMVEIGDTDEHLQLLLISVIISRCVGRCVWSISFLAFGKPPYGGLFLSINFNFRSRLNTLNPKTVGLFKRPAGQNPQFVGSVAKGGMPFFQKAAAPVTRNLGRSVLLHFGIRLQEILMR